MKYLSPLRFLLAAALLCAGTTPVFAQLIAGSGQFSAAFSAITTGTNAAATMTLGSGSALTFSGTGTVNANELGGVTLLGGTLTNTDFCTYTSSGTLLNCNTGSSGSGSVALTTSASLTTPTIAGAALSGTLSGTPTFSGNLTFSGVPVFSGTLTGTQTQCLGLTSGNVLAASSGACGSGGGGTGFGVDSGTGVVTITATCTLGAATGECGGTANNHAIRQVDLNLAGATTVTFDAISNLNTGACVRFHDAAGTVSGTNTFTLTAGASDAINGGSTGGSTSAFTTSGLSIIACVSATHNWNVGPGSIAPSTAPSHEWANQVTQNGLVYTQPGISDLSGWGTNVEAAAATTLSAAGGLTSTIASGTAALGTGAISSATCATVVTVTATNVATTDTVLASFNGDPTAVTGYIPSTSGMLTIIGYPTSGNVNFKVCNNTSSSVTPGSITLNWRVVR